MASEAVNIDFDRQTGLTLTGWPAVLQSLREIFLSDYGLRVQREWFGSFVPRALGRTIDPELLVSLSSSIATSIDRFEPRFRVTQILPAKVTRAGQLRLEIDGEYLPRALLGDETVDGLKKVQVSFTLSDGTTEVV